jgi:hypothetical protein
MADLFQRPASRKRPSARRSFGDADEKSGGSGGLFGWTIFILLLVALVAACWMGTIYIFGHPETPLGYSVLHKFKKLEPPKRFSEVAAPKGEFLDSKKLLERYGPMSARQLQKESDRLLRDYIRNYSMPNGLLPYITGRFTVLDSYELTKNDFFNNGVVALAQDSTTPQVLIESVFTTDEKLVQLLYRNLLTGLEFPIRRSYDLSPIIHVEKLSDGRLKFTTIPIQYPNYSATQGPGSFALEPPTKLNVEAGLPILSNAKVVEADRHYSTYRNKLSKPTGGKSAPTSALLPVRPATTANASTPAPVEAPETPKVARALPVPSPGTTGTAPAPASSPTVLPAIPVSTPPGETPAVAAAPTVGADVNLKPFMGGTQATVSSTTNGRWTTYKPGQMPRGKLVGLDDARAISTADLGSQPFYLQGDFTVTAAVGSSAVLRRSANDPTRIVVQYPAGSRTPEQGKPINRGGDRPFLITNVRKAPDGTVNIYVREVTTEE